MGNKYNWEEICSKLIKNVRICNPLGIKFFEDIEELKKINKIRFSEKRFSVCQGIGQALQLNWTVGILPENIHADYCRNIHGLHEKDEKFYSGKMFADVWHAPEAAKEHHCSLLCAPPKYKGIAVSPLSSNKIEDVDVCIIYATSGQLFILLSGLIYSKYQKLDFTFSGESTCNDTWIRTLLTGKPSISLPCFAERKFGGVSDNEITLSIKPEDLVTAIEGVEKLSKNGLRYPIAPYSLTTDIMAGLPESYYEY